MRMTVLIPTFRRAADLERCFDALSRQDRPADEVIVVVRSEDEETWNVIRRQPPSQLPITTVAVEEPGTVAALNAGLDVTKGDVIAIVDDDTAPWSDWLGRIERHFTETPELGGLGGRDMIRVPDYRVRPDTDLVGRLRWYGGWIGEAHRGMGPPREVELLKGCNMSFRQTAIGGITFDRRLRGRGAQWFNDSAFSLAVKRAGWRVLYDPAVRVDHYLGERPEDDQRFKASPEHAYDVAFNETLILLEHLAGISRFVFLGYGFVIGTARAPGFAQWVRRILRGSFSPAAMTAAWKGRLNAWSEYRRSRLPTADIGAGGPSPLLS